METSILTLVLVEALKEPQLEFKLHPMKVGEIDLTGALSFMPSGVLLVKDIRSIYCKLEELGDKYIQTEFKEFYNHDLFKEEYLHLKKKGLMNAIDFLDQFHANWVRYVLRRVHDQFLWLEAGALIKITKDVI